MDNSNYYSTAPSTLVRLGNVLLDGDTTRSVAKVMDLPDDTLAFLVDVEDQWEATLWSFQLVSRKEEAVLVYSRHGYGLDDSVEHHTRYFQGVNPVLYIRSEGEKSELSRDGSIITRQTIVKENSTHEITYLAGKIILSV